MSSRFPGNASGSKRFARSDSSDDEDWRENVWKRNLPHTRVIKAEHDRWSRDAAQRIYSALKDRPSGKSARELLQNIRDTSRDEVQRSAIDNLLRIPKSRSGLVAAPGRPIRNREKRPSWINFPALSKKMSKARAANPAEKVYEYWTRCWTICCKSSNNNGAH